jgi:hypothetical protein
MPIPIRPRNNDTATPTSFDVTPSTHAGMGFDIGSTGAVPISRPVPPPAQPVRNTTPPAGRMSIMDTLRRIIRPGGR